LKSTYQTYWYSGPISFRFSSTGKRSKRQTKAQQSARWPLASDRIRAVQAAENKGQAWIINNNSISNENIRYCIHPQVATAFLEKHEDCYLDDERAGMLLIKPTETKSESDKRSLGLNEHEQGQ